jgi:L-lactate dehydrogenase complex protein LldG
MSSRDAILGRIRNALAHEPPRERPPVPQVWPRENPGADAMAVRFAQELAEVHGETFRVASMDDARRKLSEVAAASGWTSIGALDRPLCRELLAGFAPERVAWAGPQGTPREKGDSPHLCEAPGGPFRQMGTVPFFPGTPQSMAGLSLGVVEADYLLADTGSAMIACGTPQERLLCYLPPACVVIAGVDRLAENLPAIWDDVARRAADPALRGEFVFITGPSRTADIEKILILGAHGPKRLVVLLVG